MGNGFGRLRVCFSAPKTNKNGDYNDDYHNTTMAITEPMVEDLGHSFCYVRPDQEDETTTFRSISGASVSANTSTPLSTSFVDLYSYNTSCAAAFESSTCFASIPLQPVPRSGPLTMDRGGVGFLSGPIERGFMSGPLEDKLYNRSFSDGDFVFKSTSTAQSFVRLLRKAISNAVSRGHHSVVTPIKTANWVMRSLDNKNGGDNFSLNLSSETSLDEDDSLHSQSLQWAQGKAGEDRVHVVISDEYGWVFVGIYDGFNGPDAPDYLLSNLYSAVHKELKGLLWEDNSDSIKNRFITTNHAIHTCSQCSSPLAAHEDEHNSDESFNTKHGSPNKWEKSHKRWKCEWDRERLELDTKLKQHLARSNSNGETSINHNDVLKALSRALMKTEEAFLDLADKMVMQNPELALMGSCVLAVLMKGEDVYVMNVGDSRAVLAKKQESDIWLGNSCHDLEKINEETLHDLESCDGEQSNRLPALSALQLTMDHSTSIDEEVERIKKEHPDDASAMANDRVKGSLKVTRAFGAGFLKQPKWNDALLEMFRIEYVGSSPYITCLPSLHHHRLGPKDRFLILSSDGLYQYFTNEEAVSEVETFIASSPDGDPAQHLVEQVLFRAANKAGMDFHELLEIPQGDRRRYHDDVSIIIISLEGRIWRSCV